MKKSEFSSLPIADALSFIAEQAGVKWDAEGVEELPAVFASKDGNYGYKIIKVNGELTVEQALEAVRLLSLIPVIRKLTDKHERTSIQAGDRLCAIHDLLAGAKP